MTGGDSHKQNRGQSIKDRPWNNPRIRSVVIQVLVFAAVAGALAYFAGNTIANLRRQGIASGFSFLDKTAGFDIIQHLIPYSEESSYGRAFFVAVINTLLVSALGVALATVLGFSVGICRLSRNFLVSRLSAVYIETVRNIPLLLQLFFWYFAVLRNLPSPRQSIEFGGKVFLNIRGLYVPRPVFEAGSGVWFSILAALLVTAGIFVARARRRQARTGAIVPAVRISLLAFTGLAVVSFFLCGSPVNLEVPELGGFNFTGGLVLIPELVALLVALTVYTSAFIAEIVRAGILAVPNGQMEAALSLGLSRGRALQLVIIPQAMRVIVPPMTSQYLNLAKNSSLAAAIAYPDLVLVFAGTVLMQTGQAVEVIALTMAVYLTISLAISYGMNRYNKRIALVER
jgi:general L-amino acid transport system permease protein